MRTAILGVGLIGGSIGLGLRSAGWPVIGWGPRRESLQTALSLGAIESVCETATSAAAEAELVIIASPIRAIPELLRAVAAGARPGTVVTDVASVKGQVMRWAHDLLPAHLEFVGGHPMAGKELQGVAAADLRLLRGCTYCLVPTSERALEAGRELARAVGAIPLVVDADEHDLAVAATSHLPFVVAAALAKSVASELGGLAGNVASGGFRDTTRVAAGSAEMHADICNFNRAALEEWLDRFQQELQIARSQLTLQSLEQWFAEARDARAAWERRRS